MIVDLTIIEGRRGAAPTNWAVIWTPSVISTCSPSVRPRRRRRGRRAGLLLYKLYTLRKTLTKGTPWRKKTSTSKVALRTSYTEFVYVTYVQGWRGVPSEVVSESSGLLASPR